MSALPDREFSEAQILEIDAQGDVANCSITEYVLDPAQDNGAGKLMLRHYNFVAPMEQAGAR